MNFIVTACTDVGIEKETNQDSVLVLNMHMCNQNLVLAVMCDGMGGLSQGEVASASIINTFHNWGKTNLADLIRTGVNAERLCAEWQSLISEMNVKIANYGQQRGIRLGSTIVAALITEGKYYILNVGDSRAYELDKTIHLITEDQTLVEQEVKRGNLTKEQALVDERRNILLQCVGASDVVYPEILVGETKKDAVYMLCSDGFRHEITEKEIWQEFMPKRLNDVNTMIQSAEHLIDVNKQRGEKDNISVALIRTY